MSEKPSGIAHHAVIHHFVCISLSLPLTLSTAIDITHAIIAIPVPATVISVGDDRYWDLLLRSGSTRGSNDHEHPSLRLQRGVCTS